VVIIRLDGQTTGKKKENKPGHGRRRQEDEEDMKYANLVREELPGC